MNITFIGAGNMAEALVAGITQKEVCPPDWITVTDISEDRLRHLGLMYGVQTCPDNAEAVRQANVVVLAVKPQVFPVIWPAIRPALRTDALVISIMAGVPSRKISGDDPIKVVRVMPNTPSLVGEGAAGIAPGMHADPHDVLLADRLMASVGATVIVKEEELDAVTALSGSGPAYVFYLLEAMLEAAEQMGLESATARKLALATVSGAAKLMQETGEEAAALRKKVTSRGGTTEAALECMERHGVKHAIVSALRAAQARSQELADG